MFIFWEEKQTLIINNTNCRHINSVNYPFVNWWFRKLTRTWIGKVIIRAKWPVSKALISSFSGMKLLEVLLPPPGWNAYIGETKRNFAVRKQNTRTSLRTTPNRPITRKTPNPRGKIMELLLIGCEKPTLNWTSTFFHCETFLLGNKTSFHHIPMTMTVRSKKLWFCKNFSNF